MQEPGHKRPCKLTGKSREQRRQRCKGPEARPLTQSCRRRLVRQRCQDQPEGLRGSRGRSGGPRLQKKQLSCSQERELDAEDQPHQPDILEALAAVWRISRSGAQRKGEVFGVDNEFPLQSFRKCSSFPTLLIRHVT